MSKLMRILAFSYIRFSTPEQLQGDSLRRQTEKARAYCERKGWTLSEQTYKDLGVSAFKGANALVGNLGEFLKAVKQKAVPPGSVLIVESIDRISRQGIDEGYDLIKQILKAGIILVTLSPEREFDVSATKSLSKGALEIQLILERAAEESERKSDRLGEVWKEKRRLAREGKQQPPRKKDQRTTKAITSRLPAWITERGGQMHLLPERAATVQRIFELAARGYGQARIVRKLTDDKVPAFGEAVVRKGKQRPATSGKWLRAYVAKLLRDGRVIGTFTPCSRGKKAEEPILDYYPAAIPQDLWLAARAGASKRDSMAGRRRTGGGAFVNLFDGLLRDARDGGTFYGFTRGSKGKGQRFIINAAGFEGHATCTTFPMRTLERALLHMLSEVKVEDVLANGDTPNALAVVEGQLAQVQDRIAELKAALLAGGSVAVVDVIRQLEEQERNLVKQQDEERYKATHPVRHAWQETQDLIKLLDSAPDPDDVRLRLRSALRRIINSVWLLIVGNERTRYALVQINFADGEAPRHYWLLHQSPRGNAMGSKPGLWWAMSVKREAPLSDLADRSLRWDETLIRSSIDQAADASIAARQAIIDAKGRAPAGLYDKETGVYDIVEVIE